MPERIIDTAVLHIPLKQNEAVSGLPQHIPFSCSLPVLHPYPKLPSLLHHQTLTPIVDVLPSRMNVISNWVPPSPSGLCRRKPSHIHRIFLVYLLSVHSYMYTQYPLPVPLSPNTYHSGCHHQQSLLMTIGSSPHFIGRSSRTTPLSFFPELSPQLHSQY